MSKTCCYCAEIMRKPLEGIKCSYCVECLKFFESFNTVNMLIEKQEEYLSREKLSQISNADDLLDKSISNLKNKHSTTWFSFVKKNNDAVSNEMKTVKKTLDTVNDNKERENNIVLFNLSESEFVSKDRNIVMSLLKSLAGDAFNINNVLAVSRQGRKSDKICRPVIVRFSDATFKLLILRASFKIK
ncbi:hypothetical protein HELRODRAFT_183590 [Helobdella robusta]|uniref:Uncharacterized protein n=1 Tax=Helobdella robusta TaxID=6412 RepID=T1FJW2_HELRO|nr:hypothetical protein HELRODRAFT_183590 [Helobdella robusta]ESO10491.1 hypothetical protein HELRODRAFT_183590 [Helobdella robusta]